MSDRHDTAEGRPAYWIDGTRLEAPRLDPGLYIVATPIGNLGDMTLRGLATLAAADVVACEDTRTSRVLFERFGLRSRLVAYHEHNADKMRPRILEMLGEGKTVALVSDAGTPLVSDPGYRLVAEAAAAGHAVVPIPGASAMLAALVTAGLPTDTFLFLGFLPVKASQRRRRLEEIGTIPATLVVYEAPHRLVECLADMVAIFGPDRPAAVARELTKRFETVRRGALGSLHDEFAAAEAIRGEIVVVVGPPATAAVEIDIDAALADALARLSVKDAAEEVARIAGKPRREVYARALELKKAGDGPR
ncbi:MAG TPA: 16S rRNA (cytidine(1402)-2'-O)-methyltransferase [Kaistiaceae bacterium]|nr:16S rRNA (cytidine(1402)-2'-O)-methyltransferase [Kaistiaceae bacterium]